MRIHTNTLTYTELAAAVRHASTAGHGKVYLVDTTIHGSRTSTRAYEVKLAGDGTTSKRRTMDKQDYAATYDSWGYFFASLFAVDPHMKCWAYDGAADFATKTKNLYPLPTTMTSQGV